MLKVKNKDLKINLFGLEKWIKHYDDKIVNREIALIKKRMTQLQVDETFEPITEFIDFIPDYVTPAFIIVLREM
jgi:hypothetical protein